MSDQTRDRLCWLAAFLVLLAGVLAWALGHPSVGPSVTPYPFVMPALWGSVTVLVVAWSIRHSPANPSFVSRFVAPLALAVTVPLSLVPLAVYGSPVTPALEAMLWPLAVVPLAAVIVGEAPDVLAARRARRVAVAAIVAAIGLAPLLYVVPAPAAEVTLLREALVAVALLGPVALVTPAGLAKDGPWALSSEPVVHMLGVAAIAATPLVVRMAVTAPSGAIAILVIPLWLAAGLLIARYVVAPLAGIATRALRQRDLIAAAAEVERRRIAADLHDGPIQSLTLLAYRLDAAGDDENAALARDVMTELRAVTSSLRLPIVDDLGAGPALEWLTTQVSRLSGFEIDLERMDDGRPPLDVEHTIFRVAQEALANATRHGRSPIRVRYAAGTDRASLIVDDAGPGAIDLPDLADGEGGLGLVGMRERAHSIGAALEIAGSPSGSRVSLVWPAAPA